MRQVVGKLPDLLMEVAKAEQAVVFATNKAKQIKPVRGEAGGKVAKERGSWREGGHAKGRVW